MEKGGVLEGVKNIFSLLDLRLLAALFLLITVASFLLILQQSARIDAIQKSNEKLIGRTECDAVRDWLDIKALLLRSRGELLSLDTGSGVKGMMEDENSAMLIKYALLSTESFMESIRGAIMMELHLGRDYSFSEAFFGRELENDRNKLDYLEKKGVEKELLEGITREKAARVIFLSKYLLLAAATEQILLKASENPEEPSNREAVDKVISVYDASMKELSSKSCREILFSRDVDKKTAELEKIAEETG